MTTHRPAGTYHPPTTTTVTGDIDRRTGQLEQRPQPARPVPRFCLTATNPSAVIAADGQRVTAPWIPWRGAVRLEYVLLTGVEVTGTTTVEIRRTGTVIPDGTLVVVEGTQRIGFDQVWTPGETLDFTVEGDLSHVLVQCWFRGEGGGGLVFSIPAGGEA